MNDKRFLIAAILSALFLTVYAQFLPKPSHTKASPGGSSSPITQAAAAPRGTVPDDASLLPATDEETVSIENAHLRVELGVVSGAVRAVVLKQYRNEHGAEDLVFRHDIPILSVAFDGAVFHVEQFQEGVRQVRFSGRTDSGPASLNYALDDKQPILRVAAEGAGEATLVQVWKQSGNLLGRSNAMEMFALDERSKYRKFGPQKGERIVPRGTIMLAMAERYFCQIARFEAPAETVLKPSNRAPAVAASKMTAGSVEVYFGPRDFFKLSDAGFQKAFPVGILGKIGLALLALLDWIAGFTRNYGVAVILFSFLVTAAMAPFTLMSFKSMRKMQVLQPQIQKIMDENKDNPTKANQAVFALYKEHRVSPMSGCLPLLLQWPIILALLQSISHNISLRGKSFLWIKDLSLPDRLTQLPISVPILGDYLNVLPIVMGIATYFQTKATTGGRATQDNPTAQLMAGPLMPILFAVMLYNFPSALVLYWVCNSVMSLMLYRWALKS